MVEAGQVLARLLRFAQALVGARQAELRRDVEGRQRQRALEAVLPLCTRVVAKTGAVTVLPPPSDTQVEQVVQRVVARHLLDAVGIKADEGHGGAVTLIQRLGSAANLNIHLHCLVLDGAYRCDADGAPILVEAAAPTDDELHALLQTVIARLIKMLTRRGVLVEDIGQTYLAEPDENGKEARTLRPLQAAAITYRIAFGPRAGQKMLTLRGAMPGNHATKIPRRGMRALLLDSACCNSRQLP